MELRPSSHETYASNRWGKSCKVLGCTVDVDALGAYCSRKRVCPAHLKADAVLVKGGGDQLYRFCQQCGKLEPLTCFMGAHRSCKNRLARRRLSKHRSRIATTQLLPADNRSSGSSTQHTWLPDQQQQSGLHSVTQISNLQSADSTAEGIAGTYGWATLPTPQAAAAAAGAADAAIPTAAADLEDYTQTWHAARHLQQHACNDCAAAAAVPAGHQQQSHQVASNSTDYSNKQQVQHEVTAELASTEVVDQAAQQQQQHGQVRSPNCTGLNGRLTAFKSKTQMARTCLAETASAIEAVQQLRRSSSKGSNMLGEDEIMPDLDAVLENGDQLSEEYLMLLLEQELGCASAAQAVKQQQCQQYSFGDNASNTEDTATALPDCTLRSGTTLDELNSADEAELMCLIERELRAAALLVDASSKMPLMPVSGQNPDAAAAAAAVSAAAVASVTAPPTLQPEACMQHAPNSFDRRVFGSDGNLIVSATRMTPAAMPGSSSCTPTAAAGGMGDVLPARPPSFGSTTAEMAWASNPSAAGVHALLPARHFGPMLPPQHLFGPPLPPLLQQQQIALHYSQLPLGVVYAAPYAPAACNSVWPMHISMDGVCLRTAAALYPAAGSACTAAPLAAAAAACTAGGGLEAGFESAAVLSKVDMLLARITKLETALLQARDLQD